MKRIATPQAAGKKIYLEGRRGTRVPVREIGLREPHPPVRLYDTSGVYTDPAVVVNLREGRGMQVRDDFRLVEAIVRELTAGANPAPRVDVDTLEGELLAEPEA